MGHATVPLTSDLSVAFITVPAAGRIRIQIPGQPDHAWDPGARHLFMFGDPAQTPVPPPLPAELMAKLHEALRAHDAWRRAPARVERYH